jgi:hypothetical protein
MPVFTYEQYKNVLNERYPLSMSIVPEFSIILVKTFDLIVKLAEFFKAYKLSV